MKANRHMSLSGHEEPAPIGPGCGDIHVDRWIDGQDGTKSATDYCENQSTGKIPAQLDPPEGCR